MKLTRRGVIAAASFAAWPMAASARVEDFTYKGWRFDAALQREPLSEATMRSYREQIDIVEGLDIKDSTKNFFRHIPCVIGNAPNGSNSPGTYSFDLKRMTMTTAPQPAQNPVFLHELLHGYHDQKLGRTHPTLLRLYEAAKAKGDWPAQAYMYTNPGEFYAMCGSVVLWGRAARPPSSRAEVQAKLPEVYDWIVRDFDLKV